LSSWLASVGIVATGGLTLDGVAMPRDTRRASAASLLAVAAEQGGRVGGEPYTWGADSTGRLTIRRASTFDLVHSGDVSTALGLSGSYTGAAAYTGAVAMPGVTVPQGLRLSGPLWEFSSGAPAEGSAVATAGLRAGVSGSVLLDVSFADAWTLEKTLRGATLDVVHAGRWVGRGRVTATSRERQGRLSSLVTLTLTLDGVA
jgi:hypothetical protein